jgi:UDP-N-acetylmuramate--alanine ligase
VLGTGDILVAEADESDGSFLRLAPTVVVITNVDREHLDHYRDFEELKRAFLDFANRVPFWGAAVLCLDDPRIRELLPDIDRRTRTYGLTAQAEVQAEDVRGEGFDTRFRALAEGHRLGEVRLRLPGRHNVANALAAIAVGLEFDVPFARIAEALEQFGGVERRFEVRGERDGVLVIDDYSHNAAKVHAALQAARQVGRARVVVAYQPHRYTRTRDQFEELADAFHDCDALVLTEIYAAGEPKIPGVESAVLADAIRARGHRDVQLVSDLADVAEHVRGLVQPGDLLIFMGAGDITRQADAYLEGGEPD